MQQQGILTKMETLHTDPISYTLVLEDNRILLNNYIGRHIQLQFTDQIYCLECGALTPKSFAQGFCYKCLVRSPLTEDCVLRPELCRAHEGIARDLEFAKTHCLIDHYVYLAVSSEVKVGITRNTQIPTRWIDQGASYAIILATVPNRYTAGMLEVSLKPYFTDKTSWQKMLKNQLNSSIDLLAQKEQAYEYLPYEYKEFISDDDTITHLNYPVLEYPSKLKSLSFDTTPTINARLMGIKGQYLLFDDGTVLNIRKHGGYKITFTSND
jgi:hypothetical protein